MNVLSRLYQYLRRYKTWALVAFGSMIVFAATQTMLMALIQPLFDEVLTPPTAKHPAVVSHDASARERVVDSVLRRDQPEGPHPVQSPHSRRVRCCAHAEGKDHRS